MRRVWPQTKKSRESSSAAGIKLHSAANAADKSFASSSKQLDPAMRFRLNPPSFVVFLFSLILAIVAIATLYARVPLVGHYVSSHRFWVLAAAYAALLAGVTFGL